MSTESVPQLSTHQLNHSLKNNLLSKDLIALRLRRKGSAEVEYKDSKIFRANTRRKAETYNSILMEIMSLNQFQKTKFQKIFKKSC